MKHVTICNLHRKSGAEWICQFTFK